MSGDSQSHQDQLDLSAAVDGLISQIASLKLDISKHKEMLDSIFANDPTYQTHDQAVKDAQKIKNQTKKQILKLPQAADLAAKISDAKSHLKNLQQDLSDRLQDYSRQTGSTTFESAAGELLEIVVDYSVRKIGQ